MPKVDSSAKGEARVKLYLVGDWMGQCNEEHALQGFGWPVGFHMALALRFMFDEDTVSRTASIGYAESRDTGRPAIGEYGRLCSPKRTSLIHTAALMNGTHTIPRATRTDHVSRLTPRLRSISQPSSARLFTSRIA